MRGGEKKIEIRCLVCSNAKAQIPDEGCRSKANKSWWFLMQNVTEL